jgi:hypothetical protein
MQGTTRLIHIALRSFNHVRLCLDELALLHLGREQRRTNKDQENWSYTPAIHRTSPLPHARTTQIKKHSIANGTGDEPLRSTHACYAYQDGMK